MVRPEIVNEEDMNVDNHENFRGLPFPGKFGVARNAEDRMRLTTAFQVNSSGHMDLRFVRDQATY